MSTVAMNDYENQLNVRLAAGNFPDAFEVDSTSKLKAFVDKGLVLDLTPYVAKLKPVSDFQGQADFDRGKLQGKQYAIVRDADVPFSSFWVRQDWLTKLNLKAPTNLDELYTVAKAFVEQDPDGNGKKDTFGITGFEFEAFSSIFGAFGVGAPDALYVKNGKLVSGATDPQAKDAIAYAKKLLDEGLIDPEIITNKNNADVDKAFQGKAGIIFKGWNNISRKTSYDKYKSINPNAEWVQFDSPVGPGGKFAGGFDYTKGPAYFMVSKSVEKDPAKLQKIIDVFNYTATEEGLRLVSYGVENKHYKMDGGKLTALPALDTEGTNFWIYQLAGRNELEYLKTKFAYISKDVQFAIDQPRIKMLNGAIYEYPAGFNKADADRYVKEETIKFLFGKRPLTEYDSFTKELDTTFKFNAFMTSAENQLKEKKLFQ
ncbi:extracellular solute-binding protein [Paenibacillus thalictri]|uniref:extracellular solute-binding protein n=1 Tax=Paenibacillus thalictri TaxID=2527873 RepID=UPI0013EF0725|nr:extracellular solute-binding protein [Paenibacillus thalictri]